MKTFHYDTIVIGTGAAGFNAACTIKKDNSKKVCIVTEGVKLGTSRNTGSDKQTYYKLGLGGSASDSVRNMAENLFAGGCVDGDNALCEAALSARCFYNLAEAGVPFPCNRYGEFVGYKTDHDPYARATSAGPLTSKFMTEVLEKKAAELDVEIHDKMYVVQILKNGNSVCGILALDLKAEELVVFKCTSVILATGGPAGIYNDSVYPQCHTGSTGLALYAGAKLQNMTEWQYGLASIAPRWNVSGTYMQVLPRIVSVDSEGNEYEFLTEYYDDTYEALSNVFLKGYQWPFDVKKAHEGSSVIDLLVYRETELRNRRVYLDFTKNPFGLESIEYEKLYDEAYEYLKSADACFGTPIDRLKKMNEPAIDLYKDKGVDLYTKYLEIALCAQHNNGGVAVDLWWQSSVDGLFVAGECAGTHGITRPGGSALNAGQVGALRASQYICAKDFEPTDDETFNEIVKTAVDKHNKIIENAMQNENNIDNEIREKRKRMSNCGSAIRNCGKMEEVYAQIKYELENFDKLFGIPSMKKVQNLYRLRDMLAVQLSVLAAMIDYSKTVKISRGSALYYDEKGILNSGLEEMFRFSTEQDKSHTTKIQEVKFLGNDSEVSWREVRPMPADDDFFENVWYEYRQNKNIY